LSSLGAWSGGVTLRQGPVIWCRAWSWCMGCATPRRCARWKKFALSNTTFAACL